MTDAKIVQAVITLPMRLKAHRAARGLSLHDVEAATGVNNVTVLNIENGKDYRVSNLIAIAEWLDRETGDPNPRPATCADLLTACSHDGPHAPIPTGWVHTPLPDGTIRMTKRNRINPLTGKPHPTESNRWENEPCVCDTDFTCMATEHEEAV